MFMAILNLIIAKTIKCLQIYEIKIKARDGAITYLWTFDRIDLEYTHVYLQCFGILRSGGDQFL